jgi:hypothetical protein
MSKKLVTKRAYEEFGKLWVKTLREELKNVRPFPKYNTGKLDKSINYKILDRGKNVELQINAEYYLNFIDKGVSGTERKFNTPYSYKSKKPPISPLLKWARAKGLGDDVAYKARWTIFRFGLKPTNVINKTIRHIEFRSGWVNRFEEHIAQNILNNIKSRFL